MPQIQKESENTQTSYAGDKAKGSSIGEAEVVCAWSNVLYGWDNCRPNMADTCDSLQFFIMAGTLLLQMNDAVRQMNASVKPRYVSLSTSFWQPHPCNISLNSFFSPLSRDVCGVGLLMENHQNLRAEDWISISLNII